jgi:hypothetical protein
MALGDPNIDMGAFIVNVQRSGYDVIADSSEFLNHEALMWLTGFWLKNATQKFKSGKGQDLMKYQIESATVALQLANSL